MIQGETMIYAPVSLEDPYSVMGVTASGMYDLAYICSNSHGKICQWSRHKPVRADSSKELTDEQFDTDSHVSGNRYTVYGMQVDIMRYLMLNYTQSGGTTDISSDTGGFLYMLAKGSLAAWEYLPPVPGTDWCRLTDFSGYTHGVENPMPMPPSAVYQLSQAGAVNVPIYEYGNYPVNAGELNLENILVPSAVSLLRPSLSTLYRGILFYNDALNDVFFLTETEPGKGHVALANSSRVTMTEKAGVWHARTFFSSERIELCDVSFPDSGFLMPGNGSSTDIVLYNYGEPYTVEITTCKYIDSARTKVNVIAKVTAYAQQLALTDIAIEYYTGVIWNNAQTFDDTSLQPGGNSKNFQYTGNALGWTKVRFCVTVNGTAMTVESDIGAY